MPDDQLERRCAERCDTLHFLDYEILDPAGAVSGRGVARTLNVSASGLLLETGHTFAPGQLLRITLGLENDLVQLTGRVAHSRPRADDLCRTGVQFVAFAAADRQSFQRHFPMAGKTVDP